MLRIITQIVAIYLLICWMALCCMALCWVSWHQNDSTRVVKNLNVAWDWQNALFIFIQPHSNLKARTKLGLIFFNEKQKQAWRCHDTQHHVTQYNAILRKDKLTIMQNVIKLKDHLWWMLLVPNVVIMNVVKLKLVIVNIFIQIVIMMNFFMMNVVLHLSAEFRSAECCCTDCHYTILVLDN